MAAGTKRRLDRGDSERRRRKAAQLKPCDLRGVVAKVSRIRAVAAVRQPKNWQRAAQLFRHAADPTRLQILLALADEPLNGESLIARLGHTPSAVAHHLARLRHGSLVITHRKGGGNSYELTPAGRTLAQAVRRLLVPVPNPPQVSIASRGVTTVDQLAALPDAEWVALNRRRGVLIRRKNRQGLDAEQMREFETLQQASVRRMQRDFPWDDSSEDRLRDLETMLLGVGPIEK